MVHIVKNLFDFFLIGFDVIIREEEEQERGGILQPMKLLQNSTCESSLGLRAGVE
jgi:hypothetical protein